MCMYFKQLLYCLLFCFSVSIACMNSTENRQQLETINVKAQVEKALDNLWKEAFNEGDRNSARAYQLFFDFVDQKESMVECNSEVLSRLKKHSLADEFGVIYDYKIVAMRPVMPYVVRGMAIKDKDEKE